MLLAQLDIVLNMGPEPYNDQADDLPAFLCRCRCYSIINLGQQLENGLNADIGQRGFSILDLTEQCIGKHDLQDRLEDVAGAIIFRFDQLRDRFHVLELVVPHYRQVISQDTRELRKHPAFNIAVLQNICDKERNLHGELHIPRICFHIIPKRLLISGIARVLQHRRRRIPFVSG